MSTLRCNERIRVSPVRVIDQNGNLLGVIPTDDALRRSREAGLDLVEVNPNERPPVCKIMDYGKHKYEISKKQKHKQHVHKLKEVRLRPKTDPHDKEIKVKHAREFLEHGDKVQFTMLFRGRERAHQDIAFETFNSIVHELADLSKVEQPPRLFGKRMTMLLIPTRVGSKPKESASPKSAPKAAASQTAPKIQPPAPAKAAATAMGGNPAAGGASA